jgi:hypothetical protein
MGTSRIGTAGGSGSPLDAGGVGDFGDDDNDDDDNDDDNAAVESYRELEPVLRPVGPDGDAFHHPSSGAAAAATAAAQRLVVVLSHFDARAAVQRLPPGVR